MNCKVSIITAQQTHWLRHVVLRPHERPEELVYAGDDASDSLHVGAFENDTLVGIASVSRERLADDEAHEAWRLRGMAVSPHAQGRGYGHALLEACLQHVTEHHGVLLWCYARMSALGFYLKAGFEVRGEAFDVAHIGPHVVMVRSMS